MISAVLTVEEMESACKTALTLDRARFDIPSSDFADTIYALAFNAGAKWAIDTVKTLAKQEQ